MERLIFKDGAAVLAEELSADVLEDLCDCASAGDCSEAVAYFLNVWKAEGDSQFMRDYLRGSGGWEDGDLESDRENLQRMVWLCACEVREHGAWFGSLA